MFTHIRIIDLVKTHTQNDDGRINMLWHSTPTHSNAASELAAVAPDLVGADGTVGYGSTVEKAATVSLPAAASLSSKSSSWLMQVCHYMIQPLVELYGGCMMVLKVS